MIKQAIQQELERGVQEEVFPGAVALVGYQSGEILALETAGNTEPGGPKMTPDTIFDLASVSKPCGTVPLLMRLVDQGRLDVFAPVAEYLPNFGREDGKEKVQIRHLLTHTSGLPWWMPFYQTYTSGDPNAPRPASKEAKRDVLDRAAAAQLEATPGERAVYSDLNFLLLGDLIEALYGKPQDEAYLEEIARPLQSGCHYRPVVKAPWPPAAPTELCHIWKNNQKPPTLLDDPICQQRGGRVRDVVHDENTWTMGGVAGHAGLFGTAMDLYKVACALRHGALVSERALSTFWLPKPPFVGTYVLGWDTPSETLSGAGRYFSFLSVGHTGFTGTSIWIDRERQLVSILLTNRVYFGRQNEKIKPFRRAYHDVLGEALGWTRIRES